MNPTNIAGNICVLRQMHSNVTQLLVAGQRDTLAITFTITIARPEQGGWWASWHGPTIGGPTPPGRGKGGPLVKNIDIVKFEMEPIFPIWSGPITSFAWAWP